MSKSKIFVLFLFFTSNATFGEEYRLARLDKSILTYYLKKPQTSYFDILVLAQGSSCESAYYHLEKFNLVKKIIPQMALLVVEKYGLDKEIQEEKNCPDEYLAYNDLYQRVADYKYVMQKLIEKEPLWSGKLYIIGGSEGALITSMLAKELNPEKIIVLVGGLGMTMAEALPISVRKSLQSRGVPEETINREIAKLPGKYLEILAEPTSTKTWLGRTNTYKYWNSVLFYEPWNSLLKFDGRILNIHGTADINSPVEGSQKLKNIFDEHNRTNLEYWELEGLDHAFKDKNGKSFMQEILEKSLEWLKL